MIADGATGLFDEHCAWRTQGALDGLFGIRAPSPEKRSLKQARPQGAVSVGSSAKDWGLRAETLAQLEAFEPGLQVKDSEALLRIGGEPAVFVRPVGKGFAIDLNLLLDRYPTLRKKGFGGGSYRALLSALLGRNGIRPAVVLDGASGDSGPTRIARHRFGGSEVIGILTEPIDVAEAYGRDGVRVYDDSTLGKVVAQDLDIRLSSAAHVVNVRTGEYLGHTDRVRAPVTAGDALVLAASPERATLKVSGPSEAQRGAHPTFTIAPSGTGRHLVRCHVFGPDGAFLPVYARNLMVEGADGTFVLPTALDDPPGRWRVSATDVVSGASANAELELR